MKRAKVLSLLFQVIFLLPVLGGAQQSTTPTIDAPQLARNVYSLTEGFVDVNGLFLFYSETGHEEPLLVLHGGPGGSHNYFLAYLLPLARTNRLIFMDERGSGRSEKLDDPSGYTVENMADDVEALRKALGLGPINLLGHSFGGVVAQNYVLRYPAEPATPGLG